MEISIWSWIIKIKWHSITKKNKIQMFEVTYSFASTLSVPDWIFLHKDFFFNYWDSCLNFNHVNNILTRAIIFKLFWKNTLIQLFRTWLPKLWHILLKSHNIRYKEQHLLTYGDRLCSWKCNKIVSTITENTQN